MDTGKQEIIVEFDENGLPLGATSTSIQNFFFLLFYSNPTIERVYVYVDGDESRVILNHARFVELIINLAGYAVLPAIHAALSTYGTFYIFDRESNTVNRVIIKGNDDLKNTQEQLQKALKRKTAPQLNPINPMDHLTFTPTVFNIPQGKNPFERDQDSDDTSSPLTITIKKR